MVLTPTWTWLSEDAASTSLRFLTEHESGWPSVTASFRVQSPSDVVVTSPDGTTQDVAAGSGETVTWTGPVDPSGTTIQIETADGEPAQIAVAELEAAPVPTAATTACVAAWDEQISG